MKNRRVPFSRSTTPRFLRPVAPVPRPFDFGFTARRPLVPLAAVIMFLNQDRKEVLGLIDAGKLKWAFDVRSEPAQTREVRVLRQSLFEYTGLYAPEPDEPRLPDEEFLKTADLILPAGTRLTPEMFRRRRRDCQAPGLHGPQLAPEVLQLVLPREPVISGMELAQCFSCTPEHIRKLIHEHTLEEVKVHRGPKASPVIARSSVVAFLRKRRMS